MQYTLDPESWTEFRALAHRMVDDMLDHLSTLRERAPWESMPAEVRASFDEPLPQNGIGEEQAYEAFVQTVLPYTNGNRHPRFWGWVKGNGTPLGMMADMLAAGMNAHLAGFDQAPALVEHEVIRWMAELTGLPSTSSGVLVTGGTMANVIGLAVARHARSGVNIRHEGVRAAGELVVYASVETHNWVRKAVELLGLGSQALRAVPVDKDHRMDVAALRERIAMDRAAGRRPICVIANAGTVNTGAFDDLEAIGELCRAKGLWLHVDGAFGAWLNASPRFRHLVRGIEHADSLGVDLHKWGYLPIDCACALVRDPELHKAAFASPAAYLTPIERGVIAGGLPFADRGIDLTRNFKALKVWLSFKAYGVSRIVNVIEQNIDDVQYFAQRVRDDARLQLLAPSVANIACFRYRGGSTDDAQLDALNREILLQLQERGIAVISSTNVNGRFALRIANTNHRSTRADFDALFDAVLALGQERLVT